ncbi:MAG TPA: hypothetical protein VII13_11960 [Vicinamibacteria bacterium]
MILRRARGRPGAPRARSLAALLALFVFLGPVGLCPCPEPAAPRAEHGCCAPELAWRATDACCDAAAPAPAAVVAIGSSAEPPPADHAPHLPVARCAPAPTVAPALVRSSSSVLRI